MASREKTTFQEALETVESLSEEQQEDLVFIIRNRLIEHRREVLARHIKKARKEYKRGEVQRGTVDDLLKEFEE